MRASLRGFILAAVGAGGVFVGASGAPLARQSCVTGFVPPTVTIPWTGTTPSAPASVSIEVASVNCAWAIEGGVPAWLGIPSRFSGNGAGTITFPTVMPNTGTTVRTGSITVDGRQLNFTQGVNPCPLSLSPAEVAIPANGGQGSFTVNTTGSGCSYAVNPDPGVAIVSGASGSNFPATVTVSMGPNQTTNVLNRSVEVSSAGIFFPANPRVLIRQAGPPVTTDAPAGGLVFAVHRASSGSPHITAPEPIRITNDESPTATWTATTTEPWLVISPASGTSPSLAAISIDPPQAANLSVGNYIGAVDIVSPVAPQTVRRISVALRITDATSFTGSPLGLLETPAQNAVGLAGAVAVTGWAVDDVGIRRVQIFRDAVGSEPPGQIFIGDATRVRGARPDVVGALPGRPELSRGGWGLMILSNVMPNGGNGMFTFTAVAEDIEGHRVVLGQRTVTFDNASSPRPFGNIDFPEQGGTMSGQYANQGWILAQPTTFIPFDGSTIRLIIDGAVQPNAAGYGFPRPDVAALFPFPQYQNANGPAVQFSIDTTQFANGLHTIVWFVTDNNGVAQGIGSRFVNIENPSGSIVTDNLLTARSASEVRKIPQAQAFVWDRRGFDDGGWSLQFAGGKTNEVRQAPGERLEVALDTWWWSKGCGPYAGYLMTGDVAAPLPPGASIDGDQGLFRWMPPAEFAGTFEFMFVRRACTGQEERIPLRVILGSK